MHDEMNDNPPGTPHDPEHESLARSTNFATGSVFTPGSHHGPRSVHISFGPKSGRPTPDEALWEEIRCRSSALSFTEYAAFIDSVLSDPLPMGGGFADVDGEDGHGERAPSLRGDEARKLQAGLRTNLYGRDAYLLLKLATEAFVMHTASEPSSDFQNSPYMSDVGGGRVLPYLRLIRRRLSEVPVGRVGKLSLGGDDRGYAIAASRLFNPFFVELIWSYWHEQGMLVQAMNAIALRYQNIRHGEGRDPLASFALDPLRPLSNLLWGYLQDEPQRLSLARRVHGYIESYNLTIASRLTRDLRPVEGRSKFLPAFHQLLYQAHQFFRDDDIATVQADAFPMLNALRELHFILAEGMHNGAVDMPTQARVEMLSQQYLLSRPEMREFLRGRVMVPYPEPWMDCVDTMKTLQGWTDVPVMYFNELGVTAEQLLLSVRYADWATQHASGIEQAANWARSFRSVIQRHLYAHRVVTGEDLTAERVEVQAPARRAGPMRGRVGGASARVSARQAGQIDDAMFDELPAASQRALPDATGMPILPRAADRARRR